MKRISMLLGLLALTMSSAYADVNAKWETPIFDFNLSCTFANSVACTARADLFGPATTTSTYSPEILKNILLIACDNNTVYSDGAVVRRTTNQGLVAFTVYSADGFFRIGLEDDPFSTTPSPKTVTATLQFPGHTVPGTCVITSTPVTFGAPTQ